MAQAASNKTEWYSESKSNGIIIQNSLPRGGPYKGPVKRNFNYSHLVFFTRIVNERNVSVDLQVSFSADSIPIPHSPDTFVKLFLPSEIMTPDKKNLFDYGISHRKSFDESTSFHRILKSKEECFFTVEAIAYQTVASADFHVRGGNRAEFILDGKDLYFRMPPQIEWLLCGRIISR